MNRKTGRYLLQKTAVESFMAFVPTPLPPHPPLDIMSLYPLIEHATSALGALNATTRKIPNTSLFIYMYVRKEALLSSQIEGTQSSFSDLMLFEQHQNPSVSIDDIEEVSNYVKAIRHGMERIKTGFPLSLRLLCEIHEVLLSGSRGCGQLPGQFRKSQNWIGGTRPGNALFVPPPVEELMKGLGELENFFHNDKLPVLIKAGLAHVQFETLHPFLDGNGRLGRLLINLLLCNSPLLQEPVLYLSLYLKQNRQRYYELLQEVREHGTWETWLEFFLNGVIASAQNAISTTHKIENLFAEDLSKIASLGRARFTVEEIFKCLTKLPQVTAAYLATTLKISAPTARSSIERLIEVGVLQEISGKQRDRVYVYRKYLDLLEQGADPL